MQEKKYNRSIMQTHQDNKVVYFEWDAPIRYFEKKSPAYFKSLAAFIVILTILAFFLDELLLIFFIWIMGFVLYVRSTIPPVHIRYKLTKFGIQAYETIINYQSIAAFTINNRHDTTIARFFTTTGAQMYIILPSTDKEAILDFLKDKIPFVDHVEKTEIEKIAGFLQRVTGF